MSDNRPATTRDPIDQAIDRAVRDLMGPDAPSDLRARVAARLERPAAVDLWWSPGRIAAAAVGIAVFVVATYLAWPSRPAPLVEPDTVVAEARPSAEPPARTPVPREATSPEGAASEPGAPVAASTPAPSRPLARIVTASAAVEPERYQFRAPRDVARLDAPGPIDIGPMPPDPIDLTPVTVEPLVFEWIAIEPIGGSR